MKVGLKLNAQLENISSVAAVDTLASPFDYTFKIQCTSCREIHGKNISIDRKDLHGSRGSANFVFKCQFCGKESSASIISDAKPYAIELSGEAITILELETRGLDLLEFFPFVDFEAKSAESKTVFREVDLSDEWYDVDETTLNEVSITDIKWSLIKL